MKKICICTAIISFAMLSQPVFAQYEGSAPAKAAFEQGQMAEQSGRLQVAIDDYRKAISLDPDFAKAHQRYIFVRTTEQIALPYVSSLRSGAMPSPEVLEKLKAEEDKETQSMIEEYEALVAKHPDKAVYVWALGQLYNEINPLRQEQYCQQAVHIDAKFAPAYQCLADIANLRGDDRLQSEYRLKVSELEPDNADAAFYYVSSLTDDPAAFHAATWKLIDAHPNTDRAAQALYWYAHNQKSDAAKIENFEQLRKEFPASKFAWSAKGTTELFDIYDRVDPVKARNLANEMVSLNPKDSGWVAYSTYANAMAKADQQLSQHDSRAALATLQSIKAPARQFDMRREELLRAHALSLNGNTSDAYATLLDSYSEYPTDEVHAALLTYGEALGKSAQSIDGDVWSKMKSKSAPAIPFSLPKFTDGKQLSLADYRGHVVIVDFWFPNCGPCRASFPHLQQIASKYKDKGFVVLAINGQEGQAPFVLPLLKGKGYDFIALEGTAKWASDVYHVGTFPSTFLIGADGRVYFHPHIENDEEQQATELEISELLLHNGQ